MKQLKEEIEERSPATFTLSSRKGESAVQTGI